MLKNMVEHIIMGLRNLLVKMKNTIRNLREIKKIIQKNGDGINGDLVKIMKNTKRIM